VGVERLAVLAPVFAQHGSEYEYRAVDDDGRSLASGVGGRLAPCARLPLTSPQCHQEACVRWNRYHAPSAASPLSGDDRPCARPHAELSATGSVERRSQQAMIHGVRSLQAALAKLEDAR